MIHFGGFHIPGHSFSPSETAQSPQDRPEDAHEAAGIAEADLDVIEAAESGGGIDGRAGEITRELAVAGTCGLPLTPPFIEEGERVTQGNGLPGTLAAGGTVGGEEVTRERATSAGTCIVRVSPCPSARIRGSNVVALGARTLPVTSATPVVGFNPREARP